MIVTLTVYFVQKHIQKKKGINTPPKRIARNMVLIALCFVLVTIGGGVLITLSTTVLPTYLKKCIRITHAIIMKKLLSFLLTMVFVFSFLCVFPSCSNEPNWEPYLDAELEMIYQAEGYTPTITYLINKSDYYDVDWAPRFMGFPLFRGYAHRYLSISPDLNIQQANEELSEAYKNNYQAMIYPAHDSWEWQRWNMYTKRVYLPETLPISIEGGSLHCYLSLNSMYYVVFSVESNDATVWLLSELSSDGTFLRIIAANTLIGLGDGISIYPNC